MTSKSQKSKIFNLYKTYKVCFRN